MGPAKGTYQKTVASARTLQQQGRVVVNGLKQTLQIEYADDTEILADYGLTPRKSNGVRSPEVKVAAAAKAAVTRTLRHTMGPKQKKSITAASAAAASSDATAPTGMPAGIEPIGATPVVTKQQ